MGFIDNCVLIEEVKKRSCLYKKKHPRYMDCIYKLAMWEDVAAKVFEENWADWDNEERKRQVKAVRTRWNGLRACFNRDLRKRIERQVKDIKVRGKILGYRYFEELLFLKPEIEIQSLKNKSPAEPIHIDLHVKEEHIEEVIPEPEIKTCPKTIPKIIQMSQKLKEAIASGNKQSSEDIISKDTTSAGNALLSISTTNLEKAGTSTDNIGTSKGLIERNEINISNLNKENTIRIISDIRICSAVNEKRSPIRDYSIETENIRNNVEVSSQGKENTVNDNEINWTNFALSLVPMFKMLPLEKALEAQTAILKVVEEYLNGNSKTSSSEVVHQHSGSFSKNNGIVELIRNMKAEMESDTEDFSLTYE